MSDCDLFQDSAHRIAMTRVRLCYLKKIRVGKEISWLTLWDGRVNLVKLLPSTLIRKEKCSYSIEHQENGKLSKCLHHVWFYPLTPRNEYYLISPYNIIPESNIKITRIMTTHKRRSRSLKQILPVSPLTNRKKCTENSMENMHTDVRVHGVKAP